MDCYYCVDYAPIVINSLGTYENGCDSGSNVEGEINGPIYLLGDNQNIIGCFTADTVEVSIAFSLSRTG